MKKLTSRILGGAETLFGVGLITYAALNPEMRDIGTFYTGGGVFIADGTADLITGKWCYLASKASELIKKYIINKREVFA